MHASIVAQKGHFRAETSGIANEVWYQADISGFLRLLAAKGVFEREQAVAIVFFPAERIRQRICSAGTLARRNKSAMTPALTS